MIYNKTDLLNQREIRIYENNNFEISAEDVGNFLDDFIDSVWSYVDDQSGATVYATTRKSLDISDNGGIFDLSSSPDVSIYNLTSTSTGTFPFQFRTGSTVKKNNIFIVYVPTGSTLVAEISNDSYQNVIFNKITLQAGDWAIFQGNVGGKTSLISSSYTLRYLKDLDISSTQLEAGNGIFLDGILLNLGGELTTDVNFISNGRTISIDSNELATKQWVTLNKYTDVEAANAAPVQSVNGYTGTVELDKEDLGLSNVTNDAQLKVSQLGVANGVAELDENGIVPASQLPAYVDEIEEYANYAALPVSGSTAKIYLTLDDNKTYRWGGTTYVEISASLALGTTSTTAYRGDRGKLAYNHSILTFGNPHNVTKIDIGLGNVPNTDIAYPNTISLLQLDYVDDTVVPSDGDILVYNGTTLQWELNTLPDTTVLANNGLTLDVDTVKLGGLLTETTYINGGSTYSLNFGSPISSLNELNVASNKVNINTVSDIKLKRTNGNGSTANVELIQNTDSTPSAKMNLYTFDGDESAASMNMDKSTLLLQAQSSDSFVRATFTPTSLLIYGGSTFQGLKYDGDYSGLFIDRSLVDKAYVDSKDVPIVLQVKRNRVEPTVNTGVLILDFNLANELITNEVTITGNTKIDISNYTNAEVLQVFLNLTSLASITFNANFGTVYSSSTFSNLLIGRYQLVMVYNGTNWRATLSDVEVSL